jgi:hypothetical protein
MSEHLKAMARAICEAEHKDPDEIVADGTAGKVRQWELCEPEARAALLALAASVRERGLPMGNQHIVERALRAKDPLEVVGVIAAALEAIATGDKSDG